MGWGGYEEYKAMPLSQRRYQVCGPRAGWRSNNRPFREAKVHLRRSQTDVGLAVHQPANTRIQSVEHMFALARTSAQDRLSGQHPAMRCLLFFDRQHCRAGPPPGAGARSLMDPPSSKVSTNFRSRLLCLEDVREPGTLR